MRFFGFSIHFFNKAVMCRRRFPEIWAHLELQGTFLGLFGDPFYFLTKTAFTGVIFERRSVSFENVSSVGIWGGVGWGWGHG